ncbi:MAG: DUF3179 domain-containing protein [Pseudomonadota bacterium]
MIQRFFATCLAAISLASAPAQASEDMLTLSKTILTGTPEDRAIAAEAIIARGDTDMVPSLVLLMRIGGAHVETRRALNALTGQDMLTWREAMEYQESNPQITPHDSYYDLKLWYWGGIDRDFAVLFGQSVDPEDLDIRFEEIAWGGALFDGIPPLDNPTMLAAEDADYLLDDDLVFGVEINGDSRAYPLRIMGWHEMLNDVIGGVPIALAYCTLCGAGILFETAVEAQEETFVFGSSGLLYRSNKLMFDRQTQSLWNQFTGQPVGGALKDRNITLNILPLTTTTWSAWKAAHPDTTVLSLETGHIRNYDSGVVYKEYFASPDLMFPTVTDETKLLQKDYVFGLRVPGGAKAWPLSAFEAEPIINDRVGFSDVVLIGDPNSRTVRAYDRKGQNFTGTPTQLTSNGTWTITEAALIGPKGQRLPRLPGHISYWFAWDGYLGVASDFYDPKTAE